MGDLRLGWGGLPLLLLFTSACSLVFDGDEYQGGLDGSVGDGAMADGMVDENAPTTPTIEIQPASPTTVDALGISITVESEDPLGEGTPTYEYAWRRDDADAGVTVPDVPADQTAKGEVWTAIVTPVVGERRGAPAEATVTIRNSPPEIVSVGLNFYRPRLDDRVRAFPSAFVDADGDPVTFGYRWFLDDTLVDGVGTDSIVLRLQDASAGQALRVEVTPNDGEDDGPIASAGPVVIDPSETAWRQREPDRTTDSEEFTLAIHDTENRRVVYWVNGALWEYALDPGRERWARLHATGDPPPELFASNEIYDRARGRALVFGGLDSDGINRRVWELDLTRGAEAWSEIAVGGGDPGGRLWSSTFIDEARDRAIVFGTVPFEGEIEPNIDVWQLDLREGMETWTLLSIGGDAAPMDVVGASWLFHPPSDTAFLMGGVLWDAGGMPSTAIDQVWALDATPGEESWALQATPLPANLIFSATSYDPVRDRGLVMHGAVDTEVDIASEAVYEFDFEARTFTELTVDDFPGTPNFLERLSYEAIDDRFVLLGGVADGVSVASVVTFDGESAWTALDMPWVTRPGAVQLASTWQDDEFLYVVGGQDYDETAHDETFRFSFAGMEWAPVEIADDSSEGAPPAAWGRGRYSGESVARDNVVFVGGQNMSGSFPPDAWRVNEISAGNFEWLKHTVASVPAAFEQPRIGYLTTTTCESDGPVVVWGGVDPSDTNIVYDDAWLLTNCSAGTDCQWTELPSAGDRPGLAFAEVSEWNSEMLVFGGLDESGSVSDILYTEPRCSGDAFNPEPVTVAGGVKPPGRVHHSFTRGSLPDTGDRWFVFGGRNAFGGGGAPFNDVWMLTDSPSWGWTELTPVEDLNRPHPRQRHRHLAGFDENRTRLIIYGGLVTSDANDELWELLIVP